MKCPTCGKPVKKGQPVCSYCGALVVSDSPKLALRPGTPPPASTAPPGSVVFEDVQPATVEDMEQTREAWPDSQPSLGTPAMPPPVLAPAGQPPTTARTRPPAWTRLVLLAFYVLVFMLLQYFLRDSRRDAADRATPALQTAGTYLRMENGAAANPKSVFSIAEDRQVVFLSAWGGDPKGHRYEIAWRAPDGAVSTASPAVRQKSSDSRRRAFTVSAVLPLRPGLQTGLWRALVSQDGEGLGESSFQLVE